MKTTLLALGAITLSAGLVGCGDDTVGPAATDASTNHTTTFEAATPTDSGNGSDTSTANETGAEAGPTLPAPPTLGTQIDRMGRPAINTALNHAFDTSSAKGPAKDAYNADSLPAHWSTNVPEFEANLAIFDGLDTMCGNQAAYGALGSPAYTTLATVLAGDVLWVNTASSTCQQYLGVELNLLGVANTDCGGRTPGENVIDLTFNAVAGTLTPGSLPGNPGPVTNGIKAPASPPSSTFPYLASPH